MCDCPADKNDTTRIIPETVTLFEKCPKSYKPGKNVEVYSVNHDLDDKKDQDQDQDQGRFLEKDSCNESQKPYSLSDCSSESSRMYKFVSPRVCDCDESGGEGEARTSPPPFVFDTCPSAEEIPQESDIENTLAIIKPEAVIYREEIVRRIYEEGFEIRQTRCLQLTPEQASEFYTDNYGDIGFARLVAFMSSAPIIVLVLAKHNAILDWRFIMGPTKVTEARLYFPDSVRARYGRRGEDSMNAVHGSMTREKAEREIHFFFPETVIEPLPRGEILVEYLWETLNPVLTKGLTLCCKLKPADPLLWLAHWLILNNPNKPRLPEDLALTLT